MTVPQNWHATAFNSSMNSTNQIHSDEMARVYGFKGGLVPGVTVSSYLLHPAVMAWGMDWLECGQAKVVVHRPLYDGCPFQVKVSDVSEESYQARLIDQQGTHCASAWVALSHPLPAPPVMRGDPILATGQEIAVATPAEMERLHAEGMFALGFCWSEANNMASYLKKRADMPQLLNFNASAFANPAFMLGITNWVLAGNAYMNPWIHMQTDSQNFGPVAQDTNLIAECRILDLFNRKGHEFVDLDVAVFVEQTSQAVMSATLRAIYKMRPAQNSPA